jgi:hypothetical protein
MPHLARLSFSVETASRSLSVFSSRARSLHRAQLLVVMTDTRDDQDKTPVAMNLCDTHGGCLKTLANDESRYVATFSLTLMANGESISREASV